MDITKVGTNIYGDPRNKYGQIIYDCRLCGEPTVMKGTKLCDRCWELDARISADPVLAQKILNLLKEGE